MGISDTKTKFSSKNGSQEKWVLRTRKISFVIVLFGFIFYLTAMLTPYWISYRDKGYSMHVGIFFSCISDSGRTTCGTSGGMTEGTEHDFFNVSSGFGLID